MTVVRAPCGLPPGEGAHIGHLIGLVLKQIPLHADTLFVEHVVGRPARLRNC